MTAQKMMRSTTAPALPKTMARRRYFSERLWEASAMTTALSPDNTILATIIFQSAAQKATDKISSNAKSPKEIPSSGSSPSKPTSASAASMNSRLLRFCQPHATDDHTESEHDCRADHGTDELCMGDMGIEPCTNRPGPHEFSDGIVGADVFPATFAPDHVTGDPADQTGTDKGQPRKAPEQARDQGRARDDDRHTDHEAHAHQEEVAFRRGRDGNRIVEAHDGIGERDAPDRGPQSFMRFDLAALFLVTDQLDADPQQQEAAHQLEIRHVEQVAQQAAKQDQQD